jgi:hypothetical protein
VEHAATIGGTHMEHRRARSRGVAFFAVLAAVGLWRLRPRMQKFWVQLATGTLLLAFGLASFGVALANQDYRRLNTECPPVSRSCIPPDIARSMARQFNRGTNPTPWWIAGSFSTCLGLIVIGSSLVVRRRASAA